MPILPAKSQSARAERPLAFRRLLRRIGFAVAAVVLAAFLTLVGIGFATLWGITRPPCSPGPTPEQFGLVAEDVRVPSRLGMAFRGYFIQGVNGATIIVTPAYGQDRGGWLHEAAVLARAGYNILTFDGRPCAGITPHSLGWWEADDVLDALEYLRSRGDVDMARVGAHGFSQAGATNLFAAARSPDLKAVTAEGGYVDYAGQALGIGHPQDAFTTLFGFGAQVGYRVATGMDVSILRPIDAISRVAPRRVLLIYGTLEPMTPGAREAARLGNHVQLWEVPGADHGDYLWVVGEDEFARRVAGFFDEALAQQ